MGASKGSFKTKVGDLAGPESIYQISEGCAAKEVEHGHRD